MGTPTEPLLLDRNWTVGSLLGETFKVFWRHKALFLAITAIVAVPYVVLVDLVWGEELTSDDLSAFHWQSFIVPAILGATVLPALITALHVVALLRIAEGERPSVNEAFGMAAERAPAAIATSVLYLLIVAVGLVLLIIPGIWLATRLYLGAQAAVVDRLGPVDALKRSAELVKNRWWQTFGRFLLASIVFGLVTAPLNIPLQLMGFGPGYVVLDAIVQTIVLSLTALFGTLVFMDYHGHRVAPGAEAYGGFEPPEPPQPQRFA